MDKFSNKLSCQFFLNVVLTHSSWSKDSYYQTGNHSGYSLVVLHITMYILLNLIIKTKMYAAYSVFGFNYQHSGCLFPTIFRLICIVIYILCSKMVSGNYK